MSWRVLLSAMFIAVLSSTAAVAHPGEGINSQLIIGRSRISVMMSLATTEALALAPNADNDQDGRLSTQEVTSASLDIATRIGAKLRIGNNGTSVPCSVGEAWVTSQDPTTSEALDLGVLLRYVLENGADFQQVIVDPNLIGVKPGPGEPGTLLLKHHVLIMDCESVELDADGTTVYRTTVGKCE